MNKSLTSLSHVTDCDHNTRPPCMTVLWHVKDENASENSVFAGCTAKANGQLHKQKKNKLWQVVIWLHSAPTDEWKYWKRGCCSQEKIDPKTETIHSKRDFWVICHGVASNWYLTFDWLSCPVIKPWHWGIKQQHWQTAELTDGCLGRSRPKPACWNRNVSALTLTSPQPCRNPGYLLETQHHIVTRNLNCFMSSQSAL